MIGDSRRDFLSRFKDESGSISVLTIFLFIILLTISITLIDLSDCYMAKRELLSIGESALTKASHSISLPDYYSNNFATSPGIQPNISTGVGSNLVPLDCEVAILKFQQEVELSTLRENRVAIKNVSCVDGVIRSDISSEIIPIVDFPILASIIGHKFQISASLGALDVFKSTQ